MPTPVGVFSVFHNVSLTGLPFLVTDLVSTDVISDAKYKRIEALLDLEKAVTKA